MTTYQEARNNAGLPLQQNRITCIPSAQWTEDPTTHLSCGRDSWSEDEMCWATSTSHIHESRSLLQQHGNTEGATVALGLIFHLIHYILSRCILFDTHFCCLETFFHSNTIPQWNQFLKLQPSLQGSGYHMINRKPAPSHYLPVTIFCWSKILSLFTKLLTSPSKPLSATLGCVGVFWGTCASPSTSTTMLSHSNWWKHSCTGPSTRQDESIIPTHTDYR